MSIVGLLNGTFTNKQIGQIIGKSAITICRLRSKLGVPAKKGTPKITKPVNRICPHCNSKFTVEPYLSKLYCSAACYHDTKKGKRVTPENFDWSKRNLNTPKRLAMLERKKQETNVPAYRRYRNAVTRLTEKIYQNHKEIINPNDLPRTLCGVEGGYQLDHIVTVRESFNMGLSIEEVCKVENLRMIPWRENLARNRKVGD